MGWDWQTFVVMARVLENFCFGGLLSVSESYKDKEGGAYTSCALSHTHNPLHRTNIGAKKKTKKVYATFSPNHDGPKSCHFDAGVFSLLISKI